MSFVQLEEMDTLLRVCSILAVTIAIHIAYLPPSTARKVVKQPSPVALGSKAFDLIALSLPVLKSFIWVVAIIEIALTTTNLTTLTLTTLHTTPFSTLGLTLILAGTSLRIACFHALKSLHTFRLSIVENHNLITSGPYAVVRHPSYTGLFLVNFGVVLWYFCPGGVFVEATTGRSSSGAVVVLLGKIASGLCIATILRVTYGLTERIREEDEMLKSAFGEEWGRWAREVPWVLVPGLY